MLVGVARDVVGVGRGGVVRVRHGPGSSHNWVLRTGCDPVLSENRLCEPIRRPGGLPGPGLILLWERTVYESGSTPPSPSCAPRARVRDEDIARLSPLKHRNLNVLGRYSFTASAPAGCDSTRPGAGQSSSSWRMRREGWKV